MKYKLLCNLRAGKDQFGYSSRSLKKGTVLFSYEGCTYGCVSDEGTAVTMREGHMPFFQVPTAALLAQRDKETKP